MAGISVILNTRPHLSFSSSPFPGDCGWREGERQLDSLQAFLEGCPWGVGGLGRRDATGRLLCCSLVLVPLCRALPSLED